MLIYKLVFSYFLTNYKAVSVDYSLLGGKLNIETYLCLLCVAVGGFGCSVTFVKDSLYISYGNSSSYRIIANRLNALVKYGYLTKVGSTSNGVRYSLSLHAEKMLFSNFDKKAFAELHQELTQVIKDHKVKAPRKPKKTVSKSAKK